MPLATGSKLGPYEILESAGAGGMGEVYRARDTRLDRTVAIKVLPEQFVANPDLRSRFEREARAISSLNHPNICTLYDVGRQDRTEYLVMEFLDGETLAARLARGPLPLEQALKIGTEIADALDKAHRQGIVHRDLKPGNIMLTKSGAKLLDFGLAKAQAPLSGSAGLSAAMTQSSPATPVTQQGTIVGTFQYMAPEQVEGRDADARSDIFAFGAVLYEMVTGRRAFEGKSAISVASAILEKEPEPVSRVQPLTPPALDYLIATCLKKDPDQRFQTAHDVALQLRWIAQGGSQAGVAAPVAARRRHREWLAWGLAALFAVAGLAAGWFLRSPQPQPVRRLMIQLPTDEQLQGIDSSLAFSPDGRKLAMTLVDKNNKSAIWIRSLDSLSTQPVNGTDGGTYPTFSPDGRWLAFFADRQLKKVDLNGGMVQSICPAEDGRGIAWGPDATIVFSPAAYTNLFSVPATGGTPTEITHRPNAGMTDRLPVFLPDGHHVLFFRGGTAGANELGIYALDLKAGDKKETKVLVGGSGPRYVSAGYLLYVLQGNLVAQPFDAGSLRTTGAPIPVAENVQYTAYRWTGSYAVSPDGLLVYRTGSGGGMYQYTWEDLQGKVLGTVGEATTAVSPSLSHDAKRAVVVLIDPKVGTPKLWMLDLVRGVMTRFSYGTEEDAYPTWSPDDSQIVFYSKAGNKWKLIEKPSNGAAGEQTLLETDDQFRPTSWSHDAKFLALDRHATNVSKSEIWILPLAGDRKPYPLLRGNANYLGGAFVPPDAKWMTYYSDESGRGEIYVVPFPGLNGKWQVSTNGAIGGGWIDKDHLSFEDDGSRLLSVPFKASGTNVELGAPIPLFGGRSLADVGGLDITSDGKRALAAIPLPSKTTPALIVVTDWTQELKK